MQHWAAPRQFGVLPGNHPDHTAVLGVSAFAFQGTNAHAVQNLCSCVGLDRVRAGSRQLEFSCNVSSAALHYMWDHQVSGTPLFPGAAFFEMAATAGCMLYGPSPAGGSALAAVTITAPLQLTARAAHPAAHMAVQCKVDCLVGFVQISSSGITRSNSHFSGNFMAVASQPSPRQSPAAVGLGVMTVLLEGKRYSAVPASACSISEGSHAVRDVSLSPAVLDCCLHLAAIPASVPASGLRVPAGVEAILISSTTESSVFHAAAAQLAFYPDSTLSDYQLMGEDGVACSIRGLIAKPFAAQRTHHEGAPQMLYEVGWLAAGVSQPVEPSVPQLVARFTATEAFLSTAGHALEFLGIPCSSLGCRRSYPGRPSGSNREDCWYQPATVLPFSLFNCSHHPVHERRVKCGRFFQHFWVYLRQISCNCHISLWGCANGCHLAKAVARWPPLCACSQGCGRSAMACGNFPAACSLRGAVLISGIPAGLCGSGQLQCRERCPGRDVCRTATDGMP